MPAFEKLVASNTRALPLAGVSIAGVQHLLGSTAGLVRGLLKTGVQPEDIALSGKIYSEHKAVKEDLRAHGVKVHGSARLDDLVAHVLTRLRRERGRVIVLDDGGRLIRRLHDEVPAHFVHRIAAVEQTQRGIRELAGLRLRFPVINVAESWAKRRFESPMIGSSVVRALENELSRLEAAALAPKGKLLLLGYGAVGRAVAGALRRRGLPGDGYRIEVFDPSRRARARARRDGVRASSDLADALADAVIVVNAKGDVGRIRIGRGSAAPNGCIFVNAASGSQEFEFLDAVGEASARRRFLGKRLSQGSDLDPIRRDEIVRTRDGREYLLVARGNVVNFTGEIDPIPPRFIQLTRGLLYLGAIQAGRETRPGLHALDRAAQRSFVSRVQADLRRTGESLASF
jgi:S-adenosylhomocysteine hydrolase